MRMESAAVAKGRRAPLTKFKPEKGSKLRALFDFFMERKGIPIEASVTIMREFGGGDTRAVGSKLNQLRDFYGLDICKIRRGRWLLAGEWFGKTYIDYVAAHLEKLERHP